MKTGALRVEGRPFGGARILMAFRSSEPIRPRRVTSCALTSLERRWTLPKRGSTGFLSETSCVKERIDDPQLRGFQRDFILAYFLGSAGLWRSGRLHWFLLFWYLVFIVAYVDRRDVRMDFEVRTKLSCRRMIAKLGFSLADNPS